MRHLCERLKPSSANGAMTPVKGFYKYLFLDGLISGDPAAHARLPKIPKPVLPPALDRDDLRRFYMAAATRSPQHLALAHLLTNFGLRVTEACNVNIPDIYNTEAGYRVLRGTGKGNKPFAMPIPYQSIAVLEAAATGRTEGPLLTTRTGERLTRNAAYGWVQTITNRSGLGRHIHPHLLRKAAITLLLDSGTDLREAQDFARHEDPRVTRRHYDLSRNRFATSAAHTIAAKLAV